MTYERYCDFIAEILAEHNMQIVGNLYNPETAQLVINHIRTLAGDLQELLEVYESENGITQ